jgi:nucleoside-diphosphate-sugar epimerase
MQTVVVIGGTGAQGSAIVKHLSSTDQYEILVLTRSTTSSAARDIADLAHVQLIESKVAIGYDIDAFSKAAQRSDYAIINTDGFALGEQAETYWGIRLFELSIRAGIKHLIWSGLDYNGPKSNYDPSLYVGHYEGKARVTGTPTWQVCCSC